MMRPNSSRGWNLLSSLFRRRPNRLRPDRARRVRPRLETFEERITPVTIDAFSTSPAQIATVTGPGTATNTVAVADPTLLGGVREIIITNPVSYNPLSQTRVIVNNGSNSLLQHSADEEDAQSLIVWDGVNDGIVTPSGLGGLDFTANGATGINIVVEEDDLATVLTLNVFTDASNFSVATVNLPGGIPFSTPTTFFVPYSSFTTAGGATGPADFTSVGAVALFIDGQSTSSNGLDLRLDIIGTNSNDNADLGVTKTVDDPTPDVGDTVNFTVTLTNAVGSSTATGVELTDVLPAGLTFAAAPTVSQGSYNTTTGLWLVGTLAAGATATLTFPATVTIGGTITNTATITASDLPDPNPGDNSATASVGQAIDIAINKMVNNSTPDNNDTITFTVTAQNVGSNGASGVTVTDLLPAGLAFGGATPSAGTSYNSANGLWTIGTLGVGATATLTISATVTTIGAKTNTATLTAATPTDVNPANDSDSVTVTPQVADLSLTKSVNNPTPAVGQAVVYTVVVTNGSGIPATGVTVTDSLPAGLTFVSAGAPAGTSYSSATGVWTIGTVPANSSLTLTITATYNGPGAVTNICEITTSDQFDPDSTPGNNAPGEDDRATATVAGAVDLAILKTVSDLTPDANQSVTFTITLTNTTGTTATGVVVTDALPAGIAFTSSSASQGSYSTGSNQWTVGTVAGNATATLTIVATVITPGAKVNTATITATTPTDGNAANNTSSVTLVPNVADLALTKTVDNVTPNVGDNVTFTIMLINAGPVAASGVTVLDLLPAGLAFVSTNQPGAYNQVTGLWTVGALAVGATNTLTITANVTNTALATNTAQVQASNQFDIDSTPGNNVPGEDDQDSASLSGASADLGITKTVNLPTPNVDDTIVYTLTLTNNGPSTATGVAVTDLLPAGLAFVSSSASIGSYSPVTGVWNVGTLAGTATATLLILANVTAPGTVTNACTITASDQPDPVPGNNTSTVDLTPQVADLTLSKVVDNPTPAAGATVTFTVVVTNNGPDVATQVSVIDALPTGFLFGSSTISQGTYVSTGLWSVGTIPLGAQATLTITATVVGATLTNTAQVSGVDQFDPDSTPNNNDPTEDDQATVALTAVSSLSGSVYVDKNGNGVREVSEPGIGGVTVDLTGTTAGGPVALTVTTAADGSYTFLGLAQGLYTLTETQPVDYNDGLDRAGTSGGLAGNDTVTNIALGAGVDATGYDFGEIGTGVSGTVFVDLNKDGLRGAGEQGIPFVTVQLFDAMGVLLLDTTTTALDGTYSFTMLAAATYIIVETQPAGFGSSTPDTITAVVPVGGLSAQDFGETVGSISGVVYVDADNNGSFDAGESPIGGVIVTVSGSNAVGTISVQTTTGSNGTYLVGGLLAGTYTVTEMQPPAFSDGFDSVGTAGGTLGNDVISAIPLSAGEDATDYNFGELGTSLSGTVFLDDNRNTIFDSGEQGVNGVTVSLFTAAGAPVGTVVTAADGTYAFTNLIAGNYVLVETQPILFGSTTANTLNLFLPSTGLTNQDFGETLGSIGGVVYVDLNNDGIRTANEPPIENAAVALTGIAATGFLIPPSVFLTGPDGTYLFTGLVAGTYTLGESQPVGFNDGLDTPGNAGGNATVNDIISAIGLAPGFQATGYNFGERAAQVSGTVYLDTNGNGTREVGEAGLSGVTIQLQTPAGAVVATTVTGANGTYLFDNVIAGDYVIVETQPTGYGSSTPDALTVTVPVGGLTNQDFGEITSSLSGFVYIDNDNDGVRDATESGIAGVVVVLSGTDATGATVNRTATTGTDGSFVFTGLLAGTYTVTETQPTQFADGLDAAGTAGGTVGNDAISAIGLGAGVVETGYTFGERGATISGTVFIDLNSSTVQDVGELGLGGVSIILMTPTGQVIGTTTTAANGTYSFTNVPAGVYVITQTQPNGYGSSTPNSLIVTLPITGLTNQNFGETTGSISGAVYIDLNGSATRETNEPGIGGVSINLTGTDANGAAVNRTVTSGADGTFSITGLVAGTYKLTETQPSGFQQGTNRVGSSGGSLAPTDMIANIGLAPGAAATNYIFGETLAPSPVGITFSQTFSIGPEDFASAGDVASLSKLSFLANAPPGQGAALIASAVYVDGLYRNLLGRAADANGVQFWTAQLQAGVPRFAVVDALWNTTEHRARQVDQIYLSVLDRLPDAGGRAFWAMALTQGTTEYDLTRLLAATPEYFSLKGGNNAGFISGLYSDILGRAFDADGLSYWVGLLNQGVSREAVINAFMVADQTYLGVVSLAYTNYLRRALDPVAMGAFLQLYRNGIVEARLATEVVLASDEFFARALSRVTG